MHSPTIYQSRADHTSLIAATTVRNTAVYDETGEKLGSIDDVMIGKRDGTVAYAIMSFGGFLGIGEKYHPLPWHMLDYDTDLGGYRVPLNRDVLKEAPNYSRDELETSDWDRAADAHYGAYGSTGSAYGSRTTPLM